MLEEEIYERKTLFQMKKEADQTGFKGTRMGRMPAHGAVEMAKWPAGVR